MLFSTRPKERREDLFDRDRELSLLEDAVVRGEWGCCSWS
ncbi:hypothetical protein JCM16161A_18820 [Vulcanisaeta sp. JCM 16161]